VTNCVSLGREIIGTGSIIGRITMTNAGSIHSNYAWEGMLVNGVTVGENVQNGAGLSATEIRSADGWADAFKAAPWIYEEGKLPILAGFEGQNNEIPDYIVDPIIPVCEINGVGYATLADALAAVKNGETIKLLANIDYYEGIVISGMSVTFDLDGKYTLNVYNISTAAFPNNIVTGLRVENNGHVMLQNEILGVAELNITGTYYGLEVLGNSSAVVSNVTAAYSPVFVRDSQVVITGDVILDLKTNAQNGSYNGVLSRGAGSLVEVGGNVKVINNNGLQGVAGIYAIQNGAVRVRGNVEVSGGRGNVSVGVWVLAQNTEVTVDGVIIVSAGSSYVRTGFSDEFNKTQNQYETSSAKTGYLEYTDEDGLCYIWVKHLDHSYIPVVTPATCTEDGYTTSTCSACGEELSSTVLPALGHTEVTDEQAATCTTDGYVKVTCSVCEEVISNTVIPALGHTEVTETEPATCTEDGYIKVTCSVCEAVISNMVIPALGHTEVTDEQAATCTTDGYVKVTCSVCEAVISYSVLDALNHDWDEGVVTIEPTETSEGEMTFTCSRCGDTCTETIPKLPGEVTVISVSATASVEKLNGNQNRLTITIIEELSDGTQNVITETIMINNNAAGAYGVGDYSVYVDTKGNDQIRTCDIV